jgi:hypothetical protein
MFLFIDDMILYIENPKKSATTIRTNKQVQESFSIKINMTIFSLKPQKSF